MYIPVLFWWGYFTMTPINYCQPIFEGYWFSNLNLTFLAYGGVNRFAIFGKF